jgi:selenocysteine lyase/cysteine desulfurase
MLTHALLAGTRELGIETKTPSDTVGPLLVLRARDAGALVQTLASKEVVVSSRGDGLRISFHVYNTLHDVEVLLSLLEENLGSLITSKSTIDVIGT